MPDWYDSLVRVVNGTGVNDKDNCVSREWVILRDECYGAGGTCGHKVWVSVNGVDGKNSNELTYIRDKYENKAVKLNGRELKATEITVFVYHNNCNPEISGNWLADEVHEIRL